MSRVFKSASPATLVTFSAQIRAHMTGKVDNGTKGLVGTEIELFVTDTQGQPPTVQQISDLLDAMAAKLGVQDVRREKGFTVGFNAAGLGDICLEPGGQVELAAAAFATLGELKAANGVLRDVLDTTAAAQGLQVTGQGHMPSFLAAADMPRSRFDAYYAYCRHLHGAAAEDLIATMKSACGVQVNLDPMGKDFHAVYRALLLADIAESFEALSARQKRLHETYASLFPEQVTPVFNALAARNNDDVVALMVDRLLTIRVPFLPDTTVEEGFRSTLESHGTPPTLGQLMERGELTIDILDNCLSLQMTMPNLRRHGVLETRAPDSVQTQDELAAIAARYSRIAYDAAARQSLLDACAGIDVEKLSQVFENRFQMPPAALQGAHLGGGLTVAGLIAAVKDAGAPQPAAKAAPKVAATAPMFRK